MADLTPNIPEVVAEIREKFEAYEQALIDKDGRAGRHVLAIAAPFAWP